MSLEDTIVAAFPRLAGTTWQITSPATERYNCVAWAANDEGRWWWPAPGYYWPERVPRETQLSAFVTLFTTLGFGMSEASAPFDPEVDRVAVFGNALGVTHVARELESGIWTSKLGSSADISHPLSALEGAVYGSVLAVMAREAS